jgi:hypothetical protein
MFGIEGEFGDRVPEFYVDEAEVPEHKPVVLRPVFSGDMFRKVCSYPVIVEMWDRRLNGSVRRRYHAEFTEKERATIARYQTKFRRWHLVVGTPRRVMMSMTTLNLLQRAVGFFATI